MELNVMTKGEYIADLKKRCETYINKDDYESLYKNLQAAMDIYQFHAILNLKDEFVERILDKLKDYPYLLSLNFRYFYPMIFNYYKLKLYLNYWKNFSGFEKNLSFMVLFSLNTGEEIEKIVYDEIIKYMPDLKNFVVHFKEKYNRNYVVFDTNKILEKLKK
jgi:hypothetical protein